MAPGEFSPGHGADNKGFPLPPGEAPAHGPTAPPSAPQTGIPHRTTGKSAALQNPNCNQFLRLCQQATGRIQSQDVAQANRHQINSSQCQTTFPSNPKTATNATPCPQKNNCGTYAEPDTCSYGTTNNGCAGDGYLVAGPTGLDCCANQSSPIVIDVNGDGFDLTSVVEQGVLFDFGGAGLNRRVSWTSAQSDDAWLVLDRNGNGVIDDGSEMFGNLTSQQPSKHPNGFLALAVFDLKANGGNEDGVISRKDAIFGSLRLWQDKKSQRHF